MFAQFSHRGTVCVIITGISIQMKTTDYVNVEKFIVYDRKCPLAIHTLLHRVKTVHIMILKIVYIQF